MWSRGSHSPVICSIGYNSFVVLHSVVNKKYNPMVGGYGMRGKNEKEVNDLQADVRCLQEVLGQDLDTV